MLVETYRALSDEEKRELTLLWPRFHAAVLATNVGDGMTFLERYHIEARDGAYVVSDGNTALADVLASSSKVLEALMEDVVLNYGR